MQKPSWRLVFLLLFSLGLACWVEQKAFFYPMALNDDVRNQVYWMARIADPHLYPRDYIAAYFTQPSLISPIVWGMYWIAGHWLDPVQFSKVLPLTLVVVASFFLYQFAKAYAGRHYATWIVFIFNISIWTVKNLSGGLPRAFFYPLIFCFLWLLYENHWKGLWAVLILSCLIYPPTYFLAVGLLMAELWHHRKNTERFQALIKLVLITTVSGFAVLAGRYLVNQQGALFGPISTGATAESTVEFYQGGRVPLFEFNHHPLTLQMPFGILEDVFERIPHLTITIPLLSLLLLYRKFGHPQLGPLLIPGPVWRLLSVSGILYVLAWIFLFYFYLPERYLQLSLPIVYIFSITAAIDLLEKKFRISVQSIQKQRFLTAGIAILALLIAEPFWKPDLLESQQDHILTQLATFFAAKPKNIMIAANPGLASNIPLLARRSVLISSEAYIPFHTAYFKEIKTRYRDWLLAYYATDLAEVISFLKKYHINYLVINVHDFLPYRMKRLPENYFHSFTPTFFKNLSNPSPDKPYILSRISDHCTVFRVESYIVIPASVLNTPDCLSSLDNTMK